MLGAVGLYGRYGLWKLPGGPANDQDARRRVWSGVELRVIYLRDCMTTDLSDREPPRLELVSITKRFGAFVANEDVSLKLDPGTFHALLGENGAGKSTLVKCIMGYHLADAGDIIVGQSVRQIRSPYDAHKLGIGMVYQHFTVAENLLLARPDLPQFIQWPAERQHLTEFLATAPFQIDLNAKVSDLAAGQKQKIEILKQLYLHS